MPYFWGEVQHTLVSAQWHPSTAGQTHFPDYELPIWGEVKEKKHPLEILRVERKQKENKAATLYFKFSGQGMKKHLKYI